MHLSPQNVILAKVESLNPYSKERNLWFQKVWIVATEFSSAMRIWCSGVEFGRKKINDRAVF